MFGRKEKENKYEGLVRLLSQPKELTSSWYLGPRTRTAETKPTNYLYLSYEKEISTFFVIGNVSKRKGEISGWQNIDMVRGIMTLVAAANAWDSIEKYIQPEYKLLLILRLRTPATDENTIYVRNSSEAKFFVDYWGKWYQELQKKNGT